jgi:hypothetical protein
MASRSRVTRRTGQVDWGIEVALSISLSHHILRTAPFDSMKQCSSLLQRMDHHLNLRDWNCYQEASKGAVPNS